VADASLRFTQRLADAVPFVGWEVVSVFKDEGRSGYSGEVRPGYEDMLKFLSRGDVQVLIARHHDRLTRNPDDFGLPDEDLRAI
jgi:DNA invertase Pin-like site-specific DNA recombinase